MSTRRARVGASLCDPGHETRGHGLFGDDGDDRLIGGADLDALDGGLGINFLLQ